MKRLSLKILNSILKLEKNEYKYLSPNIFKNNQNYYISFDLSQENNQKYNINDRINNIFIIGYCYWILTKWRNNIMKKTHRFLFYLLIMLLPLILQGCQGWLAPNVGAL